MPFLISPLQNLHDGKEGEHAQRDTVGQRGKSKAQSAGRELPPWSVGADGARTDHHRTGIIPLWRA